jgi:hypothetical protein
LDAGAFASLVDYDSYWAGAAMKEADKFCTDDLPQLDYYRSIVYFQDIPPVYATLGEKIKNDEVHALSMKTYTPAEWLAVPQA